MLPMRHACGQVVELKRRDLQAQVGDQKPVAIDGGLDLWCPKCRAFVDRSDTSIPQGTLCVVSPLSV